MELTGWSKTSTGTVDPAQPSNTMAMGGLESVAVDEYLC